MTKKVPPQANDDDLYQFSKEELVKIIRGLQTEKVRLKEILNLDSKTSSKLQVYICSSQEPRVMAAMEGSRWYEVPASRRLALASAEGNRIGSSSNVQHPVLCISGTCIYLSHSLESVVLTRFQYRCKKNTTYLR